MEDKKVIIAFLVAGVLFVIIGFILDSSFNADLQQKEPPKTSKVLSENNTSGARKQVIVTKVLDGDTVKTNTGEEIRYIGINSAEVGEPFFEEALKFNESLVLGKRVSLEFDVEEIDRYGRTLAYVFVGDKLVNLELVRSGLTVVQTIQPNVKYQDIMVSAQKEAREKCLGIWVGLCKQEENRKNDLSGCVKISFINYDAGGNDNENKNGEWAEIVNSCGFAVQFSKWILKDSSASNRYKFKDFVLNGNRKVYVYSGCGEDSSDKLYWMCPERKYAVWNNTGDHAFLYNGKGELVSEYGY